MSFGSSGRYQSRLFNLVNQQTRRLTQQWEHTFRHLQVATKWGVELLLYPLYLLFNSAESTGKTLHSKAPQPRLQLQTNDTDFSPETHPPSDSPIQQVLEAVQELAVDRPRKWEPFQPLAFLTFWQDQFLHHPTTNKISDNSENVLKRYLPLVQGIASDLANRQLVLVSVENDALDILTFQQQAKLQERIISEVANYSDYLQLAKAQQPSQLLPEIDRLLTKLTGENTANLPALSAGTATDGLTAGGVIGFLDSAIAKLETKALVPVQQRSQKIIQVAQTQFNTLLSRQEQFATKGKIAVTPDGLETHTFNLQALIEAALNYFFGVGNIQQLEGAENEKLSRLSALFYRRSLPQNPQLENEELAAEAWLNWSDLYGNGDKIGEQAITLSQNNNSALTANLSVVLTPSENLAASELVQRKKVSGTTAKPKKYGKIGFSKQTAASISEARSENKQGEILPQQVDEIEAKPDWIEIQATAIGYHKHPLEQILEWLDRAMLWLEKIFVNIFHFWQGFMRAK